MPLHPSAKAFIQLPFMKSSKPLNTLSVRQAREQFADEVVLVGQQRDVGEPLLPDG